MIKIKLLKNDELVFEKNGIFSDNSYIFENIRYLKDDLVLIREDENFKYELNFNTGKAVVELKNKNSIISLSMDVKNTVIDKDHHMISYCIESDEDNNNLLEVIFDSK